MKLIGIIDDSNNNDILIILSRVLKNFYKIKFLLSYKNIFKQANCDSFDCYLANLQNDNVDVLVMKLSSFDLHSNNLLGIKFNTIILSNVKRYISESISATDYLIYNYDNYRGYEVIQKYTLPKISYGISYHSDVFPSSIQDDYLCANIMICISKNIITASNNHIVSQEFSLKTNNCDESKIYNILASVIILLLLDIKVSTIVSHFDTIFKEESIHA